MVRTREVIEVVGNQPRKLFHICPSRLKRKTAYKCDTCTKHVCLQCSKPVCKNCLRYLFRWLVILLITAVYGCFFNYDGLKWFLSIRKKYFCRSFPEFNYNLCSLSKTLYFLMKNLSSVIVMLIINNKCWNISNLILFNKLKMYIHHVGTKFYRDMQENHCHI